MSSAASFAPQTLLREMIALPSVHPEGDAAGTTPGEAAMADWFAARLRRLGADVERQELAPGRPSVVATFEPVGRAAGEVAFVPHLDTVGVAGMTVPPFRLTRRAGRLHGRGACDTKGPTAALLAALHGWVRRPARARGRIRWVVAATAGEEQGSLGAEALARAGFRADFAVALEPTKLRVVHAAKGVVRLWIEARGEAAHGSTPDRGINAVERLLPMAAAVSREIAPALRRSAHPLLGCATVNLGILHGGTELNIVPDACRLGLDIRTHPLWPVPAVLRLIERVRRRRAPATRSVVHRCGEPFVTARTNAWAGSLARAGRGWAVANWFCDANMLAAHGIPAVAFGPGDIAQAHTPDEYIRAEELAAGVRAFAAFLRTAAARNK